MTTAKKYFEYRKKIYASINGTKGNLTKLSESKLLKENERAKLMIVIDAIEVFRSEFISAKSSKKSRAEAISNMISCINKCIDSFNETKEFAENESKFKNILSKSIELKTNLGACNFIDSALGSYASNEIQKYVKKNFKTYGYVCETIDSISKDKTTKNDAKINLSIRCIEHRVEFLNHFLTFLSKKYDKKIIDSKN